MDYLVGANRLGNTSRLARDHVGLADIVQERCFAVVHVPHNSYDWRANHGFLFGFILHDGYTLAENIDKNKIL